MYFSMTRLKIRNGMPGELLRFARRFASDGIMWQRGLLKLIDFEGWIHRDCLILWSSDVFFGGIHRNLMFLGHPDVSGIHGFMHIHRKCPI